MAELRRIEVGGNDIQLMLLKLGKQNAGKLQRVYRNGSPVQADPAAHRGNKARIERCVVGNNGAVSAKFAESADRLFVSGRSRDRRIAYARKLGYKGADGLFGINVGVERLSANAVCNNTGADLGYAFFFHVRSRCFKVKADVLAVNRLVRITDNGKRLRRCR